MKEMERSETDDRKSEHLIVPEKAGNPQYAGTRWRKGDAVLWNCVEER